MKFRKKKEIITPYSTEQCSSCKKISKRQFKEGDFVFKSTGACSSCNGQMLITKIFGETMT